MKEKIEWLINDYQERLEEAEKDNYTNPYQISERINRFEEIILDLKQLLKAL